MLLFYQYGNGLKLNVLNALSVTNLDDVSPSQIVRLDCGNIFVLFVMPIPEV